MSTQKNLTRVILAASAGNALEFFDFTVFGYFAIQIAAAFFPAHSQSASLLAAWATYGTAFLARPVGALVLGSYADRTGRRAAMTAAILIMTGGTFLMAAMPSYSLIGPLAPAGILLARLMQGFSAGGEFGGATAFMMEHAPHRRGFFASFQFTSQAASNLAGAGCAWLVNDLLAPADMASWGFRVPFAIGLLIGPVGLYLRRHVDETPVFLASTQSAAPAREVLRHSPGRVLLGAGLLAAGTAATYIGIYLPTYAQHDLHMAAGDSFLAPIIGSVVSLAVTPLIASASDRVGRFRPMVLFCALLAASSIPAFMLLSALPTLSTLLAMTVLIGLLRAGYSAPMPALLAELFPPAVRAVGMSAGYSTGVMLFGGIAPFASDWLIHITGNRAAPGWYLAACACISLAASLTIAARVRLHTDR
jgi:MHS family proline/betaine transporter-like MFS transporter